MYFSKFERNDIWLIKIQFGRSAIIITLFSCSELIPARKSNRRNLRYTKPIPEELYINDHPPLSDYFQVSSKIMEIVGNHLILCRTAWTPPNRSGKVAD